MVEEKEKQKPTPEVRDPEVPPVNSVWPSLPRQRSIMDAYTDAVLSVAYYGKLKARRGTFDSHMDEVAEGSYEM